MDMPLNVILNDKGRAIQSISPHHTVHECAEKLSQLKIGALLVMESDQLEGIISERDILRKIVVPGADATKVTVSQIMTRRSELITVTSATTIREAMRIVTDKRIRHLPVLDDGQLVGLISIGDLTRWAMLWQEQQISSLTNYIQDTRQP